MKSFISPRLSAKKSIQGISCALICLLIATSCVPNPIRDATQRVNTAVSETKRMQNSQAMTATAENLRRLGSSIAVYTLENSGKLPLMKTTQTWQKALKPYATSDLFHNPTTKTPYVLNAALSGKKVKAIKNPNNVVLGYEAKPIAGPNSPTQLFRPVLFVTGNVVVIPEKRWQTVKKSNGIK